MSYQDQSGYPPPLEQESKFRSPPGEEDDRARSAYAYAYHQRGSSSGDNLTLPSISPYDQYAAPPPNGHPADPRGYQHDPYQAPPPGQYRDDRAYEQDHASGGAQTMAFPQSAPRQRTAIACRYCRRRKIRCSGFDQNPEGRCANCQRFQQECIFTPVSSQAQAFVPAHALYPGMRNMGIGPDGRPRPMMYPPGTQLFGAHGQPLGPITLPQSGQYEYPAPSPTGSYGSFSEDRGSQPPQDQSRKRPQPEPHPSILPPPIPGQPYEITNRRQAVEDGLRLPPVTPTGATAANYSPGSSTSSQSGLQPPQQSGLQPPQQSGLPSMSSRTPPPRSSPGEGGRSDPMSLGNIIERQPDTEIDRGMLGRLDRKAK